MSCYFFFIPNVTKDYCQSFDALFCYMTLVSGLLRHFYKYQ